MAVASLSGSLGMKGVGPTDGGYMPRPDKDGMGPGGGGGGGGSAQDGLGQIDSGAQMVRGAIGTAAQALGGGSGNPQYTYKKGGSVVTTRMKPSMKRNDKCSNW